MKCAIGNCNEPASGALAHLAATLRLAGWEARTIDLDFVAGRATVELHRADGRWVLLSVDALGRASRRFRSSRCGHCSRR